MKEKVFISYSRKDAEFASSLHKSLSHYDVIYDSISLRSGKNFIYQLNKFLDESDYLIALWSTESVGSEWVLSEVHKAQDMGIGILPVIPDKYNRVYSRKIYLSYSFLSEIEKSLKKIKKEKKQEELALIMKEKEELSKLNIKREKLKREKDKKEKAELQKNMLLLFLYH